MLSKFDPATKTFTDLGRLDCPAGFSASPFSMSVDRDAFAWVLYSNEDLFRVDVKDPSSCTKTSWNSPNNLNKFGMGFSTDSVGGTTDTLFIAGGEDGPSAQLQLAAVDWRRMRRRRIRFRLASSPAPATTSLGVIPRTWQHPANLRLDKATRACRSTTHSACCRGAGEWGRGVGRRLLGVPQEDLGVVDARVPGRWQDRRDEGHDHGQQTFDRWCRCLDLRAGDRPIIVG